METPGRRSGLLSTLAAAVLLAGPAASESLDSLLLLGAQSNGSQRVVSQGEWAASLVDALGLSVALPEDHDLSDVAALLCADRAELTTQAGGRRAPARAAFRVAIEAPRPRSPSDPLRVVMSVPATALYLLSVEGVGKQRWTLDQRPAGHIDASALGVAHAPVILPLRRGPHELSAFLARGARVDRVELSAYRTLCIAPAEGWRPDRALNFGDKARTIVRALGFERRLPEAGEAMVIEGERFAEATAWGGTTNRRLSAPASAGSWATALASPAEFTYRVRLTHPGVFTLLARVHGQADQIWSIDGRYRVTLRPEGGGDDFAWSHVLTLPLSTGEHVIRALVPRKAGIDLLRVVRHRDSDSDYVDLLEEAGFEEGAPHALVTRTAAYSNLTNPNFVQLARGFLDGVVDGGDPLFLVEDELDQLYSRPLSPLLPPEL